MGGWVVIKEIPTEEEETVSVVVKTTVCLRSLRTRTTASVETIGGKVVDGRAVVVFKTDVLGTTRGLIGSIRVRAVVVSCLRMLTGETVGFLEVKPTRFRTSGRPGP